MPRLTTLVTLPRGKRGIPLRPHERPTTRRICRFAIAVGPRVTARPLALRRASLKSEDVRLMPQSLRGGGFLARLIPLRLAVRPEPAR